jgi:hypothetical protein
MEQHVGNLRWTCHSCGKSIDLPREVRCPQIPGQTLTMPEWKWHKGILEHRCRGRYNYCRGSARRRRFLVIPGRVHSIYDGDVHHVSAEELMRLYKVRRCECVVATPMDTMDPRRLDKLVTEGGLLPLRPRRDGHYDLKNLGQESLF